VRLRRVRLTEAEGFCTAVWDRDEGRWVPLRPALQTLGRRERNRSGLAGATDDMLALLDDPRLREAAERAVALTGDRDLSGSFQAEPAPLPFAPRSLRAFSLFERHQVQAARGLVRRYMPAPARALVGGFETLTRRTFPALRPKQLFYDKPLFYMGNPLTFYPHGAEVPWPGYSSDVDYELELAFVVTRPLRDASALAGADAIGGFFLVNDWSARDTQWREYRESVFGPVVKAKTFATSMSAEVVTADEILPHIEDLRAMVRVNDEVWVESSTRGMQHAPGEMVAYASESEELAPGEVFASGTLPGCCGLEIDRWIRPGDEVELELESVGTLRNRIA
jgi:2-keto-4-pentenoate hydratase/2-oxohepta-3-ene-1,7-dioic acid hydratase in catechol pathway